MEDDDKGKVKKLDNESVVSDTLKAESPAPLEPTQISKTPDIEQQIDSNTPPEVQVITPTDTQTSIEKDKVIEVEQKQPTPITKPEPSPTPTTKSVPPAPPPKKSEPVFETDAQTEEVQRPQKDSKPKQQPQVSDINSQKSDIDPVASLTLEELRRAHHLYVKRMQKEFSAKGVAKRKRTMELNLREIVDYISTDNGAPLPRIARHTNITPGTTSKYLRQLIASDKVRAEGWGKTRRFFLK